MQEPNISSDALTTATSAAPPRSLIYNSNPFLSPTSPDSYPDSSNESFFAFQNYSPSSVSDTASLDGFHESSSVLQYQQLYNRHTICLAQLEETIEAVDALRRENESLRLSNADLSHRVALLFSRDRLLSEFSRLNIASPSSAAASPPARVASLPKSISVCSKGYLKTIRPNQDTARPITEEETQLELDAYNQGMLKTELCNKWQKTGSCPYAETCQFAHGIKELRPVIRHPRYKTEVCRIVLAGHICPYGHRCHFSHSLTEQERLAETLPAPR